MSSVNLLFHSLAAGRQIRIRGILHLIASIMYTVGFQDFSILVP